ncbi:MAG: GNAT family N-acetyltransferase [Ewingella sp.]
MQKLLVSTDKARLDLALIHRFLSEDSAWGKGISAAVVEKSIEGSLCFGGYLAEQQVAFARVITDFATFANLVDVFVLPQHRGKGYSKMLMVEIMAAPELQGLRRITLATSDAHGLYAKFGFSPLNKPETFMERYQPDIYHRG